MSGFSLDHDELLRGRPSGRLFLLEETENSLLKETEGGASRAALGGLALGGQAGSAYRTRPEREPQNGGFSGKA